MTSPNSPLRARRLVAAGAVVGLALSLAACDQNMDSGYTNSREQACAALSEANPPKAEQVLDQVSTELDAGEVDAAVARLESAREAYANTFLPTSNADLTPKLSDLAAAWADLAAVVGEFPQGTPAGEAEGDQIKPQTETILTLAREIEALCP